MIKLLKSILPFKYKRKVKEKLGVPSLYWSLQNLKKKGFNPTTAADIGAFEGEWTINFLEVFPAAKILMVEPQVKKETILKNLCSQFPNVFYTSALLSSSSNKKVIFYENETASHIQTDEGEMNNLINAPFSVTKTFDEILDTLQFPFPQFLKLDVQGHEIEVLKGAQKALAAAKVCMLEISLILLDEGTPLAYDVMKFMDEAGFQLYDISQFMRRPFDKALYQLDVLFVKKNSAWITDKRWN